MVMNLWISLFQLFLSNTSTIINPTLSISISHESFHVVWCLLFCFFPGTGASTILLNTCPSCLLLTCPYNVSLFSGMLLVTGATQTCSLLTYIDILSVIVFILYLPNWRNMTFSTATCAYTINTNIIGTFTQFCEHLKLTKLTWKLTWLSRCLWGSVCRIRKSTSVGKIAASLDLGASKRCPEKLKTPITL